MTVPAGASTRAAHDAATIVSVRSPDGRRVAVVQRATGSGRISAGLSGGRRRVLYSSHDACRTGLRWASDRLLVFVDDYHVETLDALTGRVRWIAGFSDFALSRDGRQVAGFADTGGHEPTTIYVVGSDGSGCRRVPKPGRSDDSGPSFSAAGTRLRFTRRAFGGGPSAGRRESVLISALPREAAGACLAAGA